MRNEERANEDPILRKLFKADVVSDRREWGIFYQTYRVKGV